MGRTAIFLGALSLTWLVMGCNTVMHGTAPAKDGFLYAVGAKNNQPTVWLCPTSPGKGECQAVTVTEENR
jgi:hypothetical protein